MNAVDREFFREVIRDKKESFLEWLSATSFGENADTPRVIEDLERALERLDQDSLGACSACQGEIERELLAVCPTAAVCLECMAPTDIRKLEDDLRVAQEVSRSLLPRRLPRSETVEFGVEYRPSRILSGDFYDVLRTGEGERTTLVIGDVAGKGIPASLLMSSLHATLRALTRQGLEPAEVLGTANRQFSEAAHPGRFASVFYGVLDGHSGALSYANGGHNPPLVRRADGTVESLPATGVVLGVLPQMGFEQQATVLAPGDVLLLYTDGVTEAENGSGRPFGEDGVMAALDRSASKPGSTAQGIADALARELDAFSSGEPSDDRTLLVSRHA